MTGRKTGDLKGFYLVLGAVGVIAVGAMGWTFLQGALSSAAMEAIPEVVTGELTDVQALVDMATGIERGDPDAPITIMEFGDYQCPACQQFATLVKPEMDLAYIESGVARFVFHDFPLAGHPYAFLAARAARCALDQGGGYYWLYHDQLFAHQPAWSVSASAPLNAYETYAATIGLDEDEFADCLDSDRHADVVSANMRLGIELGVSGTPTIFVSRGEGRVERVTRWGEFAGIQAVVERLISEDEGN